MGETISLYTDLGRKKAAETAAISKLLSALINCGDNDILNSLKYKALNLAGISEDELLEYINREFHTTSSAFPFQNPAINDFLEAFLGDPVLRAYILQAYQRYKVVSQSKISGL